ncbi:MAG: PKD domain-containing protein [Flavobacteriales bacterium]
MIPFHKLYLLVICLFTLSLSSEAQNFEINNQTITTCGGSFQDDNGGVGDADGTEGSPYSNTSYEYTICPDNPGDVIQVNFLAFSLYTSANPNNSDYLAIFDGDSPAANSMGSYTGNQLSGIPVTGTVNNVSGCLTFVFNPSNSSTGTFPGWEGLISCTTPCAVPTAASTILDPEPDENNSVSVCLNTPITFADAGSAAQPGFTLDNYIWDFDDGTIVEGETLVEHSFTEPGEYIVTLTVVDNNGCQNLNLVPLQVLVSTIPIFSTDFTPEVCLGGTGYIDGSPVQSQTWTALPPQVVAGETYLADGAGFSYTSALVFDFFEEDQVLEDCSDLFGVSVNMEHSYMGDLDIIVTCPDGTSLFLFEQAGGGTFLGEAVDDGSTTPGVGYDYVWSPTATNGTWGENAGGVNILPAGTYESNEDMCELEGCPLNGEWTIQVIDNLAIDNGYIFEWGIDLNPELFPGITTFTPTIGLGLDSTWVEGDFMDSLTIDGNFAEITPPALGEYDYTFYASNNFGCTFDTTLVVSIVPGPVVDAGMDMLICNDPLDLEAVITSNEFEAEPCNFTFVLSNDNFGFNSSEVVISFDGIQSQTLTAFGISEEFEVPVPSGSEMTLEYVFSTWGETDGNQVTVFDDTGALIFESEVSPSEGVMFQETVTCLGDGQLQYEWTPAQGLSNPFIPNPEVTTGQTTEYTVSVFPQGFEGCVTTDQVTVSVDPAGDPGSDSTLVLCYNYGPFNLIQMLGGNPVNSGEWTDSNGNTVDGTFNTITDEGDVFTYTVINAGCINSAQVDITVLPQGDPICCIFDYNVSTTETLCNGSSDGTLTVEMLFSTEGGPWTIELFDGVNTLTQIANNTTTFTGLAAGDYIVSIEDSGLCTTNADVILNQPPVVGIQTVQDTTICLTGNALLSAWSPEDTNGTFTSNWIGLGTGDQSVAPLNTTVYEVFMTNNNNCDSPTEVVEVSLYDPLSVTVNTDSLVCQNTQASLYTLNVDGGFGGYNYSWNTSGGTNVGTQEESTAFPAQTTEYCLTLTDGCETPESVDCVTINAEIPPVISMFSTNPVDCVPHTIAFENTTDPDAFVADSWSLGDGTFTTESSFEHEYDNPGTFDVTLTLESELGCFYTEIYENYSTIYPSPEPFFTYDPIVTTIPDTEITFLNLTEGIIVDHQWVFDTTNVLGTSQLVDPVFEFPSEEGGTYPTSLSVIDFNGCEATVVFDVVINDRFNVFIPTSFTPNSDGINDVLFIKGTDVDPNRFHVRVFNRWGEVVFESRDMNMPWDGSHQFGDYFVESGVYNYVLDAYSIATTKRFEITGHITVVR